MRLTPFLRKQHLDRMFKKHWKIQSKRKIEDGRVVQATQEKGIPVYNPEDILKEEKVRVKYVFNLVIEVQLI